MLLKLNGLGRRALTLLPMLCAVALTCGCSTPVLNRARSQFYTGHFDEASEVLKDADVAGSDKVLLQMERGMVLHNLGRYDESSHDFISASDELERLRAYSVSQGAASMLINDNVQDFTGFPFEQSLLHAFTAKNHLALGHWDDAAVESRRLIELLKPDRLGKYPEDAYTRYLAGLGFELIDDWSNAQLQYKKAATVCKTAMIGESGSFAPLGKDPSKLKGDGWQLICLVSAGRVPRRRASRQNYIQNAQPVYAEIYADGKKVGRSYILTDTAQLAFTSEQIDAAREAAKTVARVALKDSIADNIEEQDAFLGALAHLILIGLLEQPDRRRWETLPRWLGVARLDLPAKPHKIEAVFRTDAYQISRVTVSAPIMTRRKKIVTFVRDIVPVAQNVVTGRTGNGKRVTVR